MLFEVGDKKAEAKTSQALREGLEVRATRSNSLIDKKKIRRKSKETQITNEKSSVKNLVNSNGYVDSTSGPYNTTLNGLSSGQKQYQSQIPQKPYENRYGSYYYH